jgi:xanthine dehydrogenase accessory factor
MENNLDQYIQCYQKLKSLEKDFCSITMVNSRGSAPQDVGARMLVSIDGIEFGTIGGGKVEKQTMQMAIEFLNSSEKQSQKMVTWNLQKDIGMTCGGEVSLFFERFRQSDNWNVVIFGAGHVSQELTRSLIRLNLNLTVMDNRSEWIAKLPKSHNLTTECHSNLSEQVAGLNENSFVILMTMGHSTDLPILAEILKSDKKFPYLGVIGSKAKRNTLLKGLKEYQVPTEKLEQFICPIGETIGSNSPAEIAISISAQLLRVRDDLFATAKRLSN